VGSGQKIQVLMTILFFMHLLGCNAGKSELDNLFLADSNDPAQLSSDKASINFSDTVPLDTADSIELTFINSGFFDLKKCQAPTIAGSGASEFSIVSSNCSSGEIKSSARCIVGVAFTPSSTGSKTASLNYACEKSEKEIRLSGMGVAFNVSTTSPSNNSTGVDGNSDIQIVLNSNLNTTLLTRSNIFLRETRAGQRIEASLSYNSTNKSITINPVVPLLPQMSYRIDLSSSLANTNAQSFSSDSIVYFTTSPVRVSSSGFSTTDANPTVYGHCTTNVTSLSASLDGSTITIADDDCSDGIWSLSASIASSGAHTLIVTGNNGSESSSNTTTLVKCASLAAITPAGAFAGGDGNTAVSAWEISTKEELARINSYINSGKYFKLTNDIDLSCSSWAALGDAGTNFDGKIDGDYYQISGLTIESPVADYQGLLGQTDTAEVSNLVIVDAYIFNTGQSHTGILAGDFQNTSSASNISIHGQIVSGGYAGGAFGNIREDSYLENIYVDAYIRSGSGYVGGLAGRFELSYVDVNYMRNLTTTGVISGYGTGNSIGGITGYYRRSIGHYLRSYVNISTTSTGSNIGGLIGTSTWSNIKFSESHSKIYAPNSSGNVGGIIGNSWNSYVIGVLSTGDIDTGGVNVGGVIGALDKGPVYLNLLGARGNISGNTKVGGIIGFVVSTLKEVTFNDSYFSGTVSGTISGGIVAQDDSTNKLYEGGKHYYNSAGAASGGTITGSAKTLSELKDQSTYSEWGIGKEKYWEVDSNTSLLMPSTMNCGGQFPNTITASASLSGSGSDGDPYQITGVGDLAAMAANLSASYILTSDIDVTEECYKWAPIGSDASPFTGKLYGNSKSILGLGINVAANGLGLFGEIEAGLVQNLNLSMRIHLFDAHRTATSVTEIGVLAGKISSGSTISNVTVAGNIFKHNGLEVGGIAGEVNSSTLQNSIVSYVNILSEENRNGSIAGFLSGSTLDEGSVYASYVQGDYGTGGAVGTASNTSTISNSNSRSAAISNHSSRSQIGGLSGSISWSSVSNSYATGNAGMGNQKIGALVGESVRGTITNSYATGNAYADPRGINRRYISALVGSMADSSVVTDCYSSGNVLNGADSISGIAGMTDTTATITRAYAAGSLDGGATNANPIIGSDSTADATVNDSFALDPSCNAGAGGGCALTNGGIGLIDSEMKDQNEFTNFDFINDWQMPAGGDFLYPILK
jgi:hypothetical protein